MDVTHLLKHIKQAILVWSFRQNTFLGSLLQKCSIWSCYAIAVVNFLQSTSINGIKLMFNENEMKILFCCCSGTSETSEMNASEECGGVVGIGQSGHLHYTPVTIAVWPPPVTPTKKIKKPI